MKYVNIHIIPITRIAVKYTEIPKKDSNQIHIAVKPLLVKS